MSSSTQDLYTAHACTREGDTASMKIVRDAEQVCQSKMNEHQKSE